MAEDLYALSQEGCDQGFGDGCAGPEPPQAPAQPGDEDYELPKATELTPPDVIRLWHEIEASNREAGQRKNRLKDLAKAMQGLALEVVEQSGQTSARAEVEPGRELQITPYDWEIFDIVDQEAFDEWRQEYEDEGGEHFYDSTPRLRESIFQDAMRLLSQNKRPLPPGVRRYTEPRVSKTAVASRRRRAS